jgi:hypothetical protein
MEGRSKQERRLEEGDRKGLHETPHKKKIFVKIKWFNIAVSNLMPFTRFV